MPLNYMKNKNLETKEPAHNPKRKLQVSVRVSPLVKALIELELRDNAFQTEGEAVESIVLRSADSPAAQALILKEAAKDPLYSAIRKALSASAKT